MNHPASGRGYRRRRWLTGAGVAGAAGLGTLALRVPRLWRYTFQEARRPVAPAPVAPRPFQWSGKGLHAAWLGHATVLLRIEGFNILTDPIFSSRAGVSVGPVTIGVKRLVAPALDLGDLPRIDLILLSHAHMDHFDLPSLRRLENRQTVVVTASETSDLLRAGRYRAVAELAWNETVRVGPASCRAFEVNHWGARLQTDTYRGYNGYLIEVGRFRVLFGGDTAWTSSFRALRGPRRVDLAVMPIGTYNPWARFHCNPEQAWRMGNDAGAEFFIPVHHQTFQLSREPLLEPIERFHAAAASAPDRIAVSRIGEEFQIT